MSSIESHPVDIQPLTQLFALCSVNISVQRVYLPNPKNSAFPALQFVRVVPEGVPAAQYIPLIHALCSAAFGLDREDRVAVREQEGQLGLNIPASVFLRKVVSSGPALLEDGNPVRRLKDILQSLTLEHPACYRGAWQPLGAEGVSVGFPHDIASSGPRIDYQSYEVYTDDTGALRLVERTTRAPVIRTEIPEDDPRYSSTIAQIAANIRVPAACVFPLWALDRSYHLFCAIWAHILQQGQGAVPPWELARRQISAHPDKLAPMLVPHYELPSGPERAPVLAYFQLYPDLYVRLTEDGRLECSGERIDPMRWSTWLSDESTLNFHAKMSRILAEWNKSLRAAPQAVRSQAADLAGVTRTESEITAHTRGAALVVPPSEDQRSAVVFPPVAAAAARVEGPPRIEGMGARLPTRPHIGRVDVAVSTVTGSVDIATATDSGPAPVTRVDAAVSPMSSLMRSVSSTSGFSDHARKAAPGGGISELTLPPHTLWQRLWGCVVGSHHLGGRFFISKIHLYSRIIIGESFRYVCCMDRKTMGAF